MKMRNRKLSKEDIRKRFKQITDERANKVRAEIDNARSLDDESLGALAVKLAGRRKIWHIVKKAIRENACKEV